MTATSGPLLERRDVAVLVPAAGQGVRLGGDVPKALRDLDGRSLLEHCLRGLAAAPSVGLIVVAAPAAHLDTVQAQLTAALAPSPTALALAPGPAAPAPAPAAGPAAPAPAPAAGPAAPAPAPAAGPASPAAGTAAPAAEPAAPVDHARPPHATDAALPFPSIAVESVAMVPRGLVVEGGSTRQESVANALAVVPPEFTIVLVHDAARALTPPALIEAVATAVREGHDAVIPVLPVVDTIKQVAPDGHVETTVDRSKLGAVQTPQGFRRDLLIKAHAIAADSHTDDAGLIERMGLPVFTVPGHAEALKITTPFDLLIAEAILHSRPTA